MELRKINDQITVSPQIAPTDVTAIKDAGFQAIICNRPDNEEPGQFGAEQIAEAANAAGLRFIFQPVRAVSDADALEFAAQLEEIDGPVLAYCRTGTRSSTLWAKGHVNELGRDAVLEATRSAGYDLSQMVPDRVDVPPSQEKSAKAAEPKKTSAKKAPAKKTTSKASAKTDSKSSAKTSSSKGTTKVSPKSEAKSTTHKPYSSKSTASKAKDKANPVSTEHHEIVLIGGGAAGISVASSLKKRKEDLDILIIDPAEHHYYQPGWTMVGGGVFDAESTRRNEKDQIPDGVKWLQKSVVSFEPKKNSVHLDDQSEVTYDRLIIAAGLQLDWDKVKGLPETLGQNGVTSNYRYDLAPYTWQLVQEMKSGRAIFTQPPMPIKCAGAPQKAMYLSASQWIKAGILGSIDIHFCNAGGVLFGVSDYVPALMKYVEKYEINLDYFHNLVEIDGKKKVATFEVKEPDQKAKKVKMEFDMIHVCPPQSAPDFIKSSPFADAAGWVDVDPNTLQSKSFSNVWALGDVMNAPNAKTAAAARQQTPIVAENVVADIKGKDASASYNGYGSCPLTVEHGKIVLAEFGYGGKLLPTLPKWILNGQKPTRRAWFLKEKILPGLYWNAMLEGREWLVEPDALDAKARD